MPSSAEIQALHDYVLAENEEFDLIALTQFNDDEAEEVDEEKLKRACRHAITFFNRHHASFKHDDESHLQIAERYTIARLYERIDREDKATAIREKVAEYNPPKKPIKRPKIAVAGPESDKATPAWQDDMSGYVAGRSRARSESDTDKDC